MSGYIYTEDLIQVTGKWFTLIQLKWSPTHLQCWAFRKSPFSSVRHWWMSSREAFKAPSHRLADKLMLYISPLYARLPLEKEDLYHMFSSDWLTRASDKPSSGSSDQLGAVGTNLSPADMMERRLCRRSQQGGIIPDVCWRKQEKCFSFSCSMPDCRATETV